MLPNKGSFHDHPELEHDGDEAEDEEKPVSALGEVTEVQ